MHRNTAQEIHLIELVCGEQRQRGVDQTVLRGLAVVIGHMLDFDSGFHRVQAAGPGMVVLQRVRGRRFYGVGLLIQRLETRDADRVKYAGRVEEMGVGVA